MQNLAYDCPDRVKKLLELTVVNTVVWGSILALLGLVRERVSGAVAV